MKQAFETIAWPLIKEAACLRMSGVALLITPLLLVSASRNAQAEAEPVSVVVESRVTDNCLAAHDDVQGNTEAILKDFGVPVSAQSDISVIVHILGHATRRSVYEARRRCVGVVSIRVSALSRSEAGADQVSAERLYSVERLLVARSGLDDVLVNNSREILDQFSRRYVSPR